MSDEVPRIGAHTHVIESLRRHAALGREFRRFVLVGFVASVVDMSVLVALVELSFVHYLVAATFGFLCGLTVNYLLSIKYVFAFRRLSHRATSEFLLFGLVGLVGLGLTVILMYVGVDLLHMWYALVKVAVIGIVMFWNFGARKALLFSTWRSV